MVKTGSTSWACNNTGSIALKYCTVSLNTYGNGLLSNSSSQLVTLVRSNSNLSLRSEYNISLVVFACSVDSGVWIHIKVFNTILNNISISRWKITSIASSILGGAVNQLLGGETSQRFSFKSINSFKSTTGGESPA